MKTDKTVKTDKNFLYRCACFIRCSCFNSAFMKYGLILGIVCLCGCQQPVKNTVHLSGQLVDMGRAGVIMRYDGAASLIGDSRDIILYTDAEGHFDTVLPLEKPEYYSISRNTLYLTPGDELKMYITTDNRQARFEGVGAEANTYMKERLFPKGGSYLEGGSNVKADFRETRKLIGSLAQVREKQLEALQNVSEEFKALEKGRIYADVINSYLYYASYADEFRGKSREETRELQKTYRAEALSEVKEKLNYLNEDRFLEVAVVRNILFYREDPEYRSYFEDYRMSPRCEELYQGFEKVSALRHDLNLQVVDDIRTVGNRMQQADFAVELQKKLEQAARLLPGQPAPDFKMTDVDGNEKKLSDFRGKLIYIDLWATWCGPCIQESPAFTALSEKYPDIEFLQISRDEQKEAWESYIAHKNSPLTQYNSVDMELAEGWQLFYIPVLFWWIKSRRSSMPMLPDRLLRKLLLFCIHFQNHKQK